MEVYKGKEKVCELQDPAQYTLFDDQDIAAAEETVRSMGVRSIFQLKKTYRFDFKKDNKIIYSFSVLTKRNSDGSLHTANTRTINDAQIVLYRRGKLINFKRHLTEAVEAALSAS